MNVDFQRAVDRYVGVPLCALASLLDRVLPRRGAGPSPRRIVVILLSEMGSLVLAQPMFAALRARYPDASLHVMLFGKNREALDLMASVPPENVIVVDDRSLGGLVRTLFARGSHAAPAASGCGARLRALRADQQPAVVGFRAPRCAPASTATRRRASTAARSSTGRCSTTPIATCRCSS